MGVPTPFVLHVTPVDGVIVMQYLDGLALSELASKASLSELLFRRRGDNLDIFVMEEVFMVDFGLASSASGVEQIGEDLYVLEMALKSAHHVRSRELFESVLSGYGERLGPTFPLVLKKFKEISKRGRYVKRVS